MMGRSTQATRDLVWKKQSSPLEDFWSLMEYSGTRVSKNSIVVKILA